ncbi:MAG TPA: histidine kinase [Stellaceae bacterium]|jgi:two-component system sensor histidine kinase UhpB
MSLRLRLIGLITVALVTSILLGVAIACYNASGSVGVEMRSALLVGRRAVENAAPAIASSSEPQRDLEHLVAVFAGNRHVRVSLAGDPAVAATPSVETSPFGHPPRWFVRLIGVPSMTERVPITRDGRPYATVVLEAAPHNETLDVWNDFTNTVIVLLAFSGATVLLIYLFIGRALHPLYRFGAALEQIGRGNFTMRIGGRLAPELSGLRDNFNRMADQLAAADTDNRHLNEQLLTVQERERGEIARDLHDEVGPYLFAINIDTDAVSRLLREGRAAEAPQHLGLIAESVRHVQQELHSAVRRLQPVGLAEFGLSDAIENMIQFWRRRHPDVDFRVAVAAGCEGYGELIDATIYRVVQECLSNALRHGRPARVAVRIDGTGRDRIVVEIVDDGAGMSGAASPGFGLRGMAERVRALGGWLTLSNQPGGGLAVTATLPSRAQRELAEAPSETCLTDEDPDRR